MACDAETEGAGQHHLEVPAAALTGTEPSRKRLAVHARQLALQPHLQGLRRHRHPLLRRMEQTRRPAVEDHVNRTPRMGAAVMINARWYKLIDAIAG